MFFQTSYNKPAYCLIVFIYIYINISTLTSLAIEDPMVNIYQSIKPPIFLFISNYLSIYLSICLSMYLRIYLHIYLPIYIYIYLSIYLGYDLIEWLMDRLCIEDSREYFSKILNVYLSN